MRSIIDYLTAREQRWQLWFWLLIFLQAPAQALLSSGGVEEAVVFRAFGMITKIGAGYSLALWLIPRFWFRKRYVLFAAGLVAWAVVFSYAARIINVHLAERLLGIGAPYESIPTMIREFSFTFNAYFDRFFGMAFWFAFIKIGIDQLRSREQLALLKREKAEAELNFLKVQMHPHFLFNTLNNLYTLTLEKSEEAPRVVIKLSEMLDYLLYQCNADRVPVEREIELIEHYISLEGLRYGRRLRLDFTHEVADPTTPVAPLLLLTLVENAFKHGVSGDVGNHSIELDLRVAGALLTFTVTNSKPASAGGGSSAAGGIGLDNLRSQLALTYPNHHEFRVRETSDRYTAELKLRL